MQTSRTVDSGSERVCQSAQLPDDMVAAEQHHAPAQQPGARFLILTLIELANAMVDQRFELAFALLRPFAQLIDKISRSARIMRRLFRLSELGRRI